MKTSKLTKFIVALGLIFTAATTAGIAQSTDVQTTLNGGAAPQQAVPNPEDIAAVEEFLFVQNAVSGSFDGERLTLRTDAPTIFFSDRPYRVFGHVTTEAYIEAWTRGPNSFAEDPPNAVLSLLGEDHVASFIVVLSDPRVDADQLSYRVAVESGAIPSAFAEASLFIDNEAWAAVGGLAVGRISSKRQTRREAAAYAQGAGSSGATASQSASHYYSAAPPAVPPPPPPPGDAAPSSVTALLDQAAAGMTTFASGATDQNRQYIEQLVQTLKTVSADYAKVGGN